MDKSLGKALTAKNAKKSQRALRKNFLATGDTEGY
jgi:hypothetical protein